jgi:hypothetical protein
MSHFNHFQDDFAAGKLEILSLAFSKYVRIVLSAAFPNHGALVHPHPKNLQEEAGREKGNTLGF